MISELRKIAPLTAIRGNTDKGEWAAEHPHTALVKLGGRSIYVLHNLKELDLDPAAAGIDVVVSGHSHRPKIETVGGVVYLNPGSAGPRRFTLPIALAALDLTGDALRPCIHEVGKMPPWDTDVSQARRNARRELTGAKRLLNASSPTRA